MSHKTVCDGCGKTEEDERHFTCVTVENGEALAPASEDEDAYEDSKFDEQYFHACSAPCFIKVLDSLVAKAAGTTGLN